MIGRTNSMVAGGKLAVSSEKGPATRDSWTSKTFQAKSTSTKIGFVVSGNTNSGNSWVKADVQGYSGSSWQTLTTYSWNISKSFTETFSGYSQYRISKQRNTGSNPQPTEINVSFFSVE